MSGMLQSIETATKPLGIKGDVESHPIPAAGMGVGMPSQRVFIEESSGNIQIPPPYGIYPISTSILIICGAVMFRFDVFI